MVSKLDILKHKKRELLKNIREAEVHKESVESVVQKLAAKYSIGEIDFEKYNAEIFKIYGKKTPEDWVKYYDDYIELCRGYIKNYDKDLGRITRKKVLKISGSVFGIIFILGVLFFVSNDFRRAVTGIVVEEIPEDDVALVEDLFDEEIPEEEVEEEPVEEPPEEIVEEIPEEVEEEPGEEIFIVGSGEGNVT